MSTRLHHRQPSVKLWVGKILLTIVLLGWFTISVQAQTEKDTSITYTHRFAPSGKVRVVKSFARLFLPKNSIQKKLSQENHVSEAARIPKSLYKEFTIDTTRVNERNVYIMSHKGQKTGKQVLFLHGGAYINNIFRQHWQFASKIISQTHCTFIIPDYPLAPAATYKEAFVMLYAIFSTMLSQTDPDDIILMGDSAGGGLALALAEKRKQDGLSIPGQIILLSPWLDITLSNPDIKEIEKKDVSLQANSLKMAGKAWAGDTATDYYMVSPINGSLEGLPPISLFIGTHDILMADCLKLKNILDRKGMVINYYEYPGLFHDWVMLVSLKESRKAISQIISLIERNN